MELAEARRRLGAEVRRRADALVAVSREIHAHPEPAFEEHRAHDLLTGVLETEGLDVERHACGLDTAFVARAGREGPTVAVICEYDALPGLGHACGHNVIAAAGLGAGLAAAALADDLGGRVMVLGTPAEEGGGGKLAFLDAGVLDGVDAAMMIHPADADLRSITSLAVDQLVVSYEGRASHAAAAPEQGRNALDAAVLGYVNVAALRQHLGPRERVHGIITDGGQRPNVVPAHSAMHWYARAATLADLDALAARLWACLRAGADATGCRMRGEWVGPRYAEVVDDPVLLEAFARNAAALGRNLREPRPGEEVVGSTDMGNVSQVVPSIHPMLAVAPRGVAIHTPEFTRYAGDTGGDRAVIDGASAMAATIADLWLDGGLRARLGVRSGRDGSA
jgi:amidohydrolase